MLAEALIDEVAAATGITGHRIVARMKGAAFAGTVLRHPLHANGYDFAVPMLPAGFVEVETGSGFVHIAPGHGAEDWELGQQHGVPVPDTVGPDGAFLASVPLFAGRRVLREDGRKGDANGAVIEALKDAAGLLATGRLDHQYPHSWRSKAPLIFRNTPQWFISMETNGLRAAALAAIDGTRFVPAGGQARLRGMIESRPDWCVSRQRVWGVPITVFTNRRTAAVLRDEAVFQRIVDAIEAEGADVWFTSDPARFLAPDYDPEDWEQVTDILEVWFDSGSTHAYVLEPRPDLKWPASLYLEGTDQHRGWFHSSLLESCGTRGRAPYEAVLTHGFVLAEDGQKMSKSLGNVVSPQDVCQQSGADILRLWVVNSDYSEDLRIGPEILKQTGDIYRRLRNTLRFLLGNLHGLTEKERVGLAEMPELERWVLHRLWQLDAQMREACEALEFHPVFAELHTFCAIDLSAFYFDVRKDCLYCDPADSPRRRAARTVLDILFDHLTAWLAPFACFTAEEAWLTRHPGDAGSVHLRLFPDVPKLWRDDALAERWDRIRAVRRVVTGAIEVERKSRAGPLAPAWISRRSASLRARRSATARRRTVRSAFPKLQGCASLSSWRAARSASAAGGCSRTSGRTPSIRASAAAAPMPSTDSPQQRSKAPVAGLGRRAAIFGLGVAAALVVIVLDQLSKWWILDIVMRPPRAIEITPFFNLVLVWNRGVSFGLFNEPGGWNAIVLPVLALAIVALLLIWLARSDNRLTGLSLGLIIGGAIGNVIDRVRFGAVIDFLDVHAAGWHWPAFNVADSAITVGAALLIADALFSGAKSS